MKVDVSRCVIVRKLTKLRAPPSAKKFFKKGNMANQYMRVRLEEIEEHSETINTSISEMIDCFSTILQTLKEHFHVLLLSTRDDKDNRKKQIADVGNQKRH